MGSTVSPLTDRVLTFSIKSLESVGWKLLTRTEQVLHSTFLNEVIIDMAHLTGVIGGPSGSSFLGEDKLLQNKSLTINNMQKKPNIHPDKNFIQMENGSCFRCGIKVYW